MHHELPAKFKLIPTLFPTEEERDFWARFAKQHFYTDDSMPVGIWWVDRQYRSLYANEVRLNAHNIPAQNFMGHKANKYYPENIAHALKKIIQQVYKTKNRYCGESITTHYDTGENIYWRDSIVPLINPATKNLMGAFAISINITAEKKMQKIQDEYDNLALQLINKIHSAMSKYRIKKLYAKIGENAPQNSTNTPIELTTREKEVIYLLSHHKTAKEISQLLTKIEGKEVSNFTVHSIISKSLYNKFNVSTTSELLQKANTDGLIPIAL